MIESSIVPDRFSAALAPTTIPQIVKPIKPTFTHTLKKKMRLNDTFISELDESKPKY